MKKLKEILSNDEEDFSSSPMSGCSEDFDLGSISEVESDRMNRLALKVQALSKKANPIL